MISGEFIGLLCLLGLALVCVALVLAVQVWRRLYGWWYSSTS